MQAPMNQPPTMPPLGPLHLHHPSLGGNPLGANPLGVNPLGPNPLAANLTNSSKMQLALPKQAAQHPSPYQVMLLSFVLFISSFNI